MTTGSGVSGSQLRHLAALTFLLFVPAVAPGCITWNEGLAPVHPQFDDTVSEVPPVLEWVATNEPADVVRYQLVVNDSQGLQVYEASDIEETRHAVLAALPKGRYEWTVRALHLRGDRWIPGPWSQRRYFVFALVYFQWGYQRYAFELPHSLVYKPSAPDHEANSP